MATMNLSLPEALKEWVQTQVDSGRYSNTSDYMRDLIRREQDRLEKIEAMQARVKEGLESGAGTRSIDEIKEEARAQAAQSGDYGV